MTTWSHEPCYRKGEVPWTTEAHLALPATATFPTGGKGTALICGDLGWDPNRHRVRHDLSMVLHRQAASGRGTETLAEGG